MRLQSFTHRLWKQFHQRSWIFQLLSVFAFFYLLIIVYCRSHFYKDPTSLFFNIKTAYMPAYSIVRKEQAETFIKEAALTPQTKASPDVSPRICVGILSIARDGARYLKSAVGSLLEGLDESERATIHLMVFIAQTNPTLHPAFSETWLKNAVDTILLYNLPPEQLDHIKQVEGEVVHFVQKHIFDYSYLLNACSKTDASYIAMLEDDVVALDGWYHRTWNGLEIAKRKTRLRGASTFLYLRLFYTEKFLGWNVEEWPHYTFWSLAVVAIQITLFNVLRRYSTKARSWLNTYMIIVISGICTPLCILLFFAAGRASMLPLAEGVNEMSNYGCCAQGLVFPSSRVPDLLEYYESRNMTGFPDVLTEEMADEHNEIRWAITPSVIQHTGQISTKGDIFESGWKSQVSLSQSLWNFAFEKNDAGRLKEEHIQALKLASLPNKTN